MDVALLATALLVGGLLAVQASVNIQLSAAVKTPYGASTMQLMVATGALAVVALAAGTMGAVSLVPEVTWWHLLGGLASPLYITSGILLFPRLGALAAVGLFVTGQVLASLCLDLFGLIGVPRQALTIGTALGVGSVLAGITLIIRPHRPAGARTPAGVTAGTTAAPAGPTTGASGLAWTALGVLAGAVLPVQGAVNGRLRADLDAPATVGMISFIVATLTITTVLVVMLALRRTPPPQLRPLARMPWWGWLGGLCAAAYVTTTFLLIPEIGAAATVALTVTGQQSFAAMIDNHGLFRMPRRPLSPRRLGGLGLLVAGSVLVQLA
jgi:bacterial/archaeal transporter family-2 protein